MLAKNILNMHNVDQSNQNSFISAECNETTYLLSNSVSKDYWVAQRYVLTFMGFLAVVNAYMMRVVLSVAITAMTTSTQPSAKNITLIGVCPIIEDNTTNFIVANLKNTFQWSEEIQGLVLSSFFWGYIITQVPGGILAEKFGGKYVLGLGILSTALFTLITPVVVKAGDWPWLIVLRIFVGLGEGTTYPALNVLLAKWVPLSERATLGTLVYAGTQMGNVLGNAISGVIIGVTQSWEWAFYAFGIIGVIWFILWTLLCYSDPNTHPFISSAEKSYLAGELSNFRNKKKIPWKDLLTSIPLWALVIAGLGYDWGLYTMVTDLPKYMKSILKYDVEQSGVWSSVPYLVMWLTSIIAAWICDYLIDRNYMSITFARKFFTVFNSIIAGAFLLAASYAGCDKSLTIIFFTIAMGFMGACYCGIKVNSLDLSSNYAGAVMAIVNGIGTLSGMLAPYIVGIITKHQTILEWRTVFWMTYGICIVTNTIYVLFGSGEEQWWNFVGIENAMFILT